MLKDVLHGATLTGLLEPASHLRKGEREQAKPVAHRSLSLEFTFHSTGALVLTLLFHPLSAATLVLESQPSCSTWLELKVSAMFAKTLKHFNIDGILPAQRHSLKTCRIIFF